MITVKRGKEIKARTSSYCKVLKYAEEDSKRKYVAPKREVRILKLKVTLKQGAVRSTERLASQCQLLRNPAGRCESVHLHGTLFTKTLRQTKLIYRFSQA